MPVLGLTRDPAEAAAGGQKRTEGRGKISSPRPLPKSECALYTLTSQKMKAREGRRAWRQGRRKLVLNKTAFVCVLCEMERARQGGERRMPLATAAKPLKRLKRALGSYWKSWHGFAFGATSAWGWRHVDLGWRCVGLGSMRSCQQSTWGQPSAHVAFPRPSPDIGGLRD